MTDTTKLADAGKVLTWLRYRQGVADLAPRAQIPGFLYTFGQIADALEAALRAAPAAEIPREPTQAMIDAAFVVYDGMRPGSFSAEMTRMWRAMHDAAINGPAACDQNDPSPSQEGVGGAGSGAAPIEGLADAIAPTRVTQTIVEGPHANCMQAAIASLFHLPIESAPDLTSVDDWVACVRRWAVLRGLGFITIGCAPEVFRAEFSRGYLIVAGKSKRGRDHAVIYCDGELWHDPHPDSDGLVAIEYVDYFYPLNPAATRAYQEAAAELAKMTDRYGSSLSDALRKSNEVNTLFDDAEELRAELARVKGERDAAVKAAARWAAYVAEVKHCHTLTEAKRMCRNGIAAMNHPKDAK